LQLEESSSMGTPGLKLQGSSKKQHDQPIDAAFVIQNRLDSKNSIKKYLTS
jgi:hypothetical protein